MPPFIFTVVKIKLYLRCNYSYKCVSMQIDTMRITAKQNRSLQKAFNMSKSQHFKLPRKPKKAFIKRYNRKMYNYWMVRQYLQYKSETNLNEKQKQALFGVNQYVANSSNTTKKLAKICKQVTKQIEKFNEMLSDRLEKTFPEFSFDIETNNEGFLLTIQPHENKN